MAKIQFDGARTIYGITESEDFGIFSEPVATMISGTTSYLTVEDVVLRRGTDATLDHDTHVSVLEGEIPVAPVFSTLTPEICSVDQSGNANRVASGTGIIKVSTEIGTRQVQHTFSRDYQPTVEYFDHPVPGTLAANMVDTMHLLTDGKQGGFNGFLENRFPHGSGDPTGTPMTAAGTPDPNFYLKDVDISWNATHSTFGVMHKGGSLISSRHAVLAAHTQHGDGDPSNVGDMAWMAHPPAGVFHGASAVGYKIIRVNEAGHTTDLAVVYFDRDIPVTPALLFPDSWQQKAPSYAVAATQSNDDYILTPVISDFPRYHIIDWYFSKNYARAGFDGSALHAFSRPSTEFATWGNGADYPISSCALLTCVNVGSAENANIQSVLLGKVSVLGHYNTEISRYDGIAWVDMASLVTQLNTTMNELSAVYVAGGGTDPHNGTYACRTIDTEFPEWWAGLTNFS